MVEHTIRAASAAAAARIPETIATWVREHPAFAIEPAPQPVPMAEGSA